MIRRCFALSSAFLLAMLFLPTSAGSATASGVPVTKVTVSFTELSGAPMADANVGIFYLTPAQAGLPDGSRFTMDRLASGVTDAQGRVTVAVNTSGIPRTDLGDIGDGGPNAFNAHIEAIDRLGNFAVRAVVLVEGAQSLVSARVTEPAPSTASPAASPPQLSGDGVVLAHAFRYTPVAVLNAGAGMRVVLNYTTNKDTSRQTEVTQVLVGGGTGFSVGDFQLEEHDRMIVSPLKETGPFHRWVWANYRYNKVKICAATCGPSPSIEWDLYEFTGQAITSYNPDKNKHHKMIKVVPYKEPPFTPGSANQDWFELTRANSGWTRSTGKMVTNDASGTFTFPDGANIGIESKSVYGSITSVTYDFVDGCGKGFIRVVWGYRATPAETGHLEADCKRQGTV
jgi:hypothetical protein